MTAPRRDRRGSSRPDTGERRRREDEDAIDRLVKWMDAHDDWAREWTATMAARVKAVEDRADLLDGQAGNDQGLLGAVGELRGELRAIRERQDRLARAADDIRAEVRDLKGVAGRIDGNTSPPPERSFAEKTLEFGLKVLLPVLLVVVPAVTAIIVAYIQLKGQLVNLTTPTSP